MEITKIAGPPGTGKTTDLLEIVLRFLDSGIHPKEIIFSSFTRAAVSEALSRAVNKFEKYTEDDFPFFRTIHSLCFRGISRSNVLSRRDWMLIAEQTGLYFTSNIPGDPKKRASKGDIMLAILGMSRSFDITIEEAWIRHPDNRVCDVPQITHLRDTINAYKEAHEKIDFIDMLEKYLNEGEPITAKVAIVDEFQDLSPLQVRVIDHMTAKVDHLVIAGDDDQTIHEWAGASSQLFIDFPGNLRVLEQSYRIPRSVHTIAEKIIARIPNRLVKDYRPREEEGKVEFIDDIFNTPVDQYRDESWLLLVRNSHFADSWSELCIKKGMAYTSAIAQTIDPEIIPAVINWKRLQRGEWITAEECRMVYRRLRSRDRVQVGYKTVVEQMNDNEILNLDRLIQEFGLTQNLAWSEMFSLSDDNVYYLTQLEALGQLESSPRIDISTIHSSKGREADNVGIITDVTFKTYCGMSENPEPEHRVWYVGVTRAKKRLFIIHPATSMSYNIPTP
jgi:DNA helicase-2/ATP-dependent DNA helicase PcrA